MNSNEVSAFNPDEVEESEDDGTTRADGLDKVDEVQGK